MDALEARMARMNKEAAMGRGGSPNRTRLQGVAAVFHDIHHTLYGPVLLVTPPTRSHGTWSLPRAPPPVGVIPDLETIYIYMHCIHLHISYMYVLEGI